MLAVFYIVQPLPVLYLNIVANFQDTLLHSK